MTKKTASAKTDNQPVVLVATGASGGHMFPALAVAEELRDMGVKCVFVGGGGTFKQTVGEAGHIAEALPASPWNVKNPVKKALALFNLLRALVRAMRLILKYRPSAVFGTGGYATVATVVAGRLSGVPTIIQEQNVLPGRANRFLSRHVEAIALAFDPIPGSLPPTRDGLMKVLGNPVRRAVLKAAKNKRGEVAGHFNLLVVGGSQGARVLSDVVPAAVALLEEPLRKKIKITQQARPEDLQRVSHAYAQAGVEATVASFFQDLPTQMGQTHLIIARAGASAVAEAAILHRASIFVPLKLADGHQYHNAKVAEKAGAALIMEEPSFTPKALAEKLATLMNHPEQITIMEKAAATIAKPNASADVAREVLALAKHDVMAQAHEISPNSPSTQEDESQAAERLEAEPHQQQDAGI